MADAELDELGVALPGPPLSPNPFRSSPNHLLQPKPRRLLSEDQFEPLPPPRAGSPFKMQLIESLDPHDSLDSNTIHSLAGQLNVRQLSPPDGTDDAYEPMIRACVKIFCTHLQPTYTMPWARGEEARSTGSAFAARLPPLAAGEELHPGAAKAAGRARCLVTNAHVVENHALIQVRRAGDADKYVARVVCIGTDLDLALRGRNSPR